MKIQLKSLLVTMSALWAVMMFLALFAHSDTVFKYGGQIPKKDEGLGASKILLLSYQKPFYGFLYQEYQGGFWIDNAGDGRKSSFVGSYSIGVNVDATYAFGQASIGPALISSPDSLLGGPFQIENQISFGLKDPKTEATIGISYAHFSSGGIELPNRGRDFLMFRVGIPW